MFCCWLQVMWKPFQPWKFSVIAVIALFILVVSTYGTAFGASSNVLTCCKLSRTRSWIFGWNHEGKEDLPKDSPPINTTWQKNDNQWRVAPNHDRNWRSHRIEICDRVTWMSLNLPIKPYSTLTLCLSFWKFLWKYLQPIFWGPFREVIDTAPQ